MPNDIPISVALEAREANMEGEGASGWRSSFVGRCG